MSKNEHLDAWMKYKWIDQIHKKKYKSLHLDFLGANGFFLSILYFLF